MRAYSAFVERDQRSDVKSINLRNAERDRVAPVLVERGPGAAEEPLQVIAARHALFDFEATARAILSHLDERDEEIRNAIAQLLDVGVLIGRAFVAVNRDALMHDIPGEILLFA